MSSLEIDAVTADVDTGEHDFRMTGGDQTADLPKDLSGPHRPAAAAGVGDDGIAAECVAAVLDLHESPAAVGKGGIFGTRAAAALRMSPTWIPVSIRIFQQLHQAPFLLVAGRQRNARNPWSARGSTWA